MEIFVQIKVFELYEINNLCVLINTENVEANYKINLIRHDF